MKAIIPAVLRDFMPEVLGPTYYYEHLFQATPLLPGEEFDDDAQSTAEAESLHASGARALVEATPIGPGRHPAASARISRSTGLHVIHATGVHRQEHYRPNDPLLNSSQDELREQLRSELVDSLVDTEVRAGLVKAEVGLWSVSTFERRALAAAGNSTAELNTPVMVHLEDSASHEVLHVLAEEGCPAGRARAHRPQPRPFATQRTRHPRRLPRIRRCGPAPVLARFSAGGLLGRRRHRRRRGTHPARRGPLYRLRGMPGLVYLLDRFVPRVQDRIGPAATGTLLRDNPGRWLAWEVAP